MQPSYSFSRKEKLHLQHDFKRVFQTGRKLAHPAIFIYIGRRPDELETRRLGLVTSRKLGSAVERNRLKRRLREIFRLSKHDLSPAIDVIFVPRPGACGLNYEALRSAVLGLFAKAGALKK